MGYKPNRNKGKINDVVNKILDDLELNSFIFIDTDTTKLKFNDCFKIELNLDSDLFSPTNNYTKFYFDEYEKIIQCKSPIDSGRLVRLFLAIKKHLGTQYPFVWPSIRSISNLLGVSKGTNICNAIDDLVASGSLYTHDIGSYKDNNGKRKNVNTYYAFEPDKFDGAYEHALEYVRNLGIDIKEFDPKIENLHLKKQKANKKIVGDNVEV